MGEEGTSIYNTMEFETENDADGNPQNVEDGLKVNNIFGCLFIALYTL